jgi:hypothetical protein
LIKAKADQVSKNHPNIEQLILKYDELKEKSDKLMVNFENGVGKIRE